MGTKNHLQNLVFIRRKQSNHIRRSRITIGLNYLQNERRSVTLHTADVRIARSLNVCVHELTYDFRASTASPVAERLRLVFLAHSQSL